MKIVGLVGASFCGSTIFGRTLSSLPDVYFPGELHWLLDPHDVPVCYMCGEDCPVFSREFAATCTPENIYTRVASSIGALRGVLVSGDKLMQHYERYSRQPDVFVYLTRDPLTHVASLARERSEKEAARVWKNFTLRTLEALKRQGSAVLRVPLELFLLGPQEAVDWLSSQTDIVPKGKVWLPYQTHNCGGNRHGAASHHISPERPWKRSPENVELVREIVAPAVEALELCEFPTYARRQP